MNTMRQFDVLKKYITSLNVKTLSKREITDLLQILYALYHDYEFKIINSDAISIPELEFTYNQGLFDPTISFPHIGRFITDIIDNQLLRQKDSHLQQDEYRELVEQLCDYLSYSSPDSIYPKELSQLFQFILEERGSRNVYNPFA